MLIAFKTVFKLSGFWCTQGRAGFFRYRKDCNNAEHQI